MTVYLGLIAALILFSLLIKATVPERRRQEKIILFWSMAAVFLLLALKKDTVGIDIPGYEAQFQISAGTAWLDLDYVYFEKGYILLMKLFSKNGLSFRLFTAAIYALLFTGYYRFLLRFSENVTLSVLMLLCYQFLVFHTSALRQTLAMAVCIHAFLALHKGHRLRYFLLTALAVTFHRSALIFFAVYPIFALKGRRLPGIFYFAAGAAAILLRPAVWTLAKRLFPEVIVPEGMVIGGNCLFLLGMAVFLLYTHAVSRSGQQEGFFAHMALAAFFGDLILSGSTLLRSNMLFTLFLLPGIPNAIARYEHRTRLVLQIAFGCFLIALFYHDTLAINQLELLPYAFFWQ